jgi:hypothetical protein
MQTHRMICNLISLTKDLVRLEAEVKFLWDETCITYWKGLLVLPSTHNSSLKYEYIYH